MYQTHIFANGLRLIHNYVPNKAAYCGLIINVGSRDEREDELGMADFIEHVIFKGTEERKDYHILSRLEDVGGELNAYTTKEDTCVYATFMAKDYERALELFADIVFQSVFPEKEIEKEKDVVLDEINSYKDNPGELIFDDFEELIFPNHPLGRNILGNPELLRQFTSEDARKFVHSHYRPENMIFFVQGDIPFQKVIRTLEKVTSDIPQFEEGSKTRKLPSEYKPSKLILHKDTHQAHVMIGGRGYHAYDEKRTGLYLLNNILGGPGMNSRLNISLREKRGLVYNVESNLTSYTDTGTFCIYFGCDLHDADHCISLVHKELKKIRENALTELQLAAAKKQIIGQIGVAGDNFENNALNMGKCFLHYHTYEEKEEVFKRIESLTSSQLLDIANEMFAEDYLSTLIYQ